jgi:glycosyltransferase involved in cell wall biosynthesis
VRVLHVIPSYLPATRYGGPVFATHALCAALVRQGCEVEVATTTIDGAGDVPVEPGKPVVMDGVTIRYFSSPWLRRLYYAPRLARALRDAPRPDLVHAHSVFLWPTWAAARAARARGIPRVLSPRGMLVQDLVRRRSPIAKRAWIAMIERGNIESAAAIHVTSEIEAQELRGFGFRLPPLVAIPNGVDVTAALDASSRAPDATEPVVLALGRVHWKKGLDRLVEAMVHLPRVKLLIVGNDEEGYADKLRALAAQRGVMERVEIRGPAYGEEKLRLYRRCTLLALPSLSENFGNVVLEAMAAGCPVVVTPEVGAAPIVRAAGGGIVAAGDPRSLAQAIGSIVDDEGRRAQLAEAGREHVVRGYSWDAVARRMIEAYRAMTAA